MKVAYQPSATNSFTKVSILLAEANVESRGLREQILIRVD